MNPTRDIKTANKSLQGRCADSAVSYSKTYSGTGRTEHTTMLSTLVIFDRQCFALDRTLANRILAHWGDMARCIQHSPLGLRVSGFLRTCASSKNQKYRDE